MIVQTYYSAGYYTAELAEPDWHPGLNLWGTGWYPDIDHWCEESFGASDLWGEEPVNGWKRMRNKYFFISNEELAMFVLRWS